MNIRLGSCNHLQINNYEHCENFYGETPQNKGADRKLLSVVMRSVVGW